MGTNGDSKPNGQRDLFDPHVAEKMRDAAIARVGDNAEDAWKRRAFHAIAACARGMDTFTTDDVWRRMSDHVR